MQNAKKPPLCKPSLKWSLKKKMIKSNIISSKQVIPHHTKLNENFKKNSALDFVDIIDDVVEVMVVISSVIK